MQWTHFSSSASRTTVRLRGFKFGRSPSSSSSSCSSRRVEVVALAAVEGIAELLVVDALEGGAGSVLAFAAAEGSVWWSVAV